MLGNNRSARKAILDDRHRANKASLNGKPPASYAAELLGIWNFPGAKTSDTYFAAMA